MRATAMVQMTEAPNFNQDTDRWQAVVGRDRQADGAF